MPSIPVQVLILADGSIPGSGLAVNAEIAATQQAQRAMQSMPIAMTDCRVWDAMQTMVLGTAANDDLGLTTGTPGTQAITISTGDVKNGGAVTRKVAFELEVPSNYDDANTFEIRLRCGMQTTIASVSATVDLQVWKPDGSGLVGSDLCTSAAASINSLTPADKDFSIDASGLDPGDKLLCVATIATNDSATATAVIANIYAMFRRCDLRG